MFENIGFGELVVILIVALLVFGPNKLPELGKSLGAGIREFKKATQALTDEVTKVAVEETTTRTTQLTSSASASPAPAAVAPAAVAPATIAPAAAEAEQAPKSEG